MTAAALVCLEPEIGSHGDVTSPLRYSINGRCEATHLLHLQDCLRTCNYYTDSTFSDIHCDTINTFSTLSLNLHSHDLRVPVGSLSLFKLSLPQCNVPGVLNCMSGRLSGFLACIDDICVLALKIISIDRTKGQSQFKHPAESFGEVYAPSLVN